MKFSELKETILNINPVSTEDLDKIDIKELETVTNHSFKVFSFLSDYRNVRKAQEAFK